MTTNERLQRINEQTAATLSTQVGLAMHPDSIAGDGPVLVDGPTGPGETVYVAGRAALASLYTGLTAMHNARTELLEPVVRGKQTTMEVPAERAPQLAAAMGAKFESVAKNSDRNLAAINEAIGQLSQRVATAISNPRRNETSVAQAASEIRGYVKGLKNSSERLAFLKESLDAADHEVVTAVLATSNWVSGLTRQEFELLRDMAEQKFCPREHAQRAAAMKIKEAVMTASGKFVADYVKLVPRIAPDRGNEALRKLQGQGA